MQQIFTLSNLIPKPSYRIDVGGSDGGGDGGGDQPFSPNTARPRWSILGH